MSEQLRQKMTEFSVAPPAAAWEAITARLADDAQYAAVSAKMNNFETAPPPAAWNTVAERIYNDKQYNAVAGRMNNFDIVPPSAAWEAIAARLDDDKQYAVVATKMNGFDAAPPAHLLNNIFAALEEKKEEKAPVVGLRKTMYRLAAAAAVIIFFIGGWMLYNQNNGGTAIVKNQDKPAAQPVRQTPMEDNRLVTKGAAATQKEDKDIVRQGLPDPRRSKIVQAGFTDNSKPSLRYAMVNDLPAYTKSEIKIPVKPILDKKGNIMVDLDVLTINNNYRAIIGPNGAETRISSKLANAILYLYADDSVPEENLVKVMQESAVWKRRFREWRSKISQSSFFPSAANFLDIAEFKELIQE